MKRWVVVGAGAAGCAVAARLAEPGTDEVVLLEAGPLHPRAEGPDVGPVVDDPERLWVGTRAVRGADGEAIGYPQGFGVGGSSLVNAGVVFPPYDASARHRLPLERAETLGPVASALLAAAPGSVEALHVRRDGRRVTAADAYLADPKPNLEVATGTTVRTLRRIGSTVTGVVVEGGARIPADEVVLCAGAINTPAILLRSGLAGPGIGEGVTEHPAVSAVFPLRHPAPPSAPTVGAGLVEAGLRVATLDRVGGLAGWGGLVGGPTAVSSRGHITIDPDGEPVVHLGSLTTAADRAALVDAIERISLLADAAPFAALGVTADDVYIDRDGTRLGDIREAPDEWVAGHAGGLFHVSSSCHRAVDQVGRVIGCEGLRIADASVFPMVPPVNPYLDVVLLAERLVRAWLTAS